MENLHNLIDTTLSKKVTRKEFLQYAGLALLTVVGLGGVIKNLQRLGKQHGAAAPSSYGMSTYGGGKR